MRFTKLLFIIFSLFIITSCSVQKNTPKKITDRRENIRKIPKVPREIVREPQTDIKDTPRTVVTPPPANASYAEVVAAYISNYSNIAKEEMLQYGIPASIKIAQGILESGAGRGELSRRSNNHFGIKCHTTWTGDKVYHDDDEAQECFRKYNDPKYSFRDHSLFLTTRPRYNDLFKLKKDDYKEWAKGLRKAGYATDPKYPEKLIGIIERYELYKLDQEVLGNKVSIASPESPNKLNTYQVKAGDTLYSIGRNFNIPVETLKQYNGLLTNELKIGQVLYLNPK